MAREGGCQCPASRQLGGLEAAVFPRRIGTGPPLLHSGLKLPARCPEDGGASTGAVASPAETPAAGPLWRPERIAKPAPRGAARDQVPATGSKPGAGGRDQGAGGPDREPEPHSQHKASRETDVGLGSRAGTAPSFSLPSVRPAPQRAGALTLLPLAAARRLAPAGEVRAPRLARRQRAGVCPHRAPPPGPLALVRAVAAVAAAAAARGRTGGCEAAAAAAPARPSLVLPGPTPARPAGAPRPTPSRPGASRGSGAAGRAQARP